MISIEERPSKLLLDYLLGLVELWRLPKVIDLVGKAWVRPSIHTNLHVSAESEMMRPLASVEESIADVEQVLVAPAILSTIKRARRVWFEPNNVVKHRLVLVVEQGDAHKTYSLDHVQQGELIHDLIQEFLRHRCTKVHEDKGAASSSCAGNNPEVTANILAFPVSHSVDRELELLWQSKSMKKDMRLMGQLNEGEG